MSTQKFYYHLLIFISFLTCITFFVLWCIKYDILKNVGNQTVSVPINLRVCVCVRVCVRACVRVCVSLCTQCLCLYIFCVLSTNAHLEYEALNFPICM